MIMKEDHFLQYFPLNIYTICKELRNKTKFCDHTTSNSKAFSKVHLNYHLKLTNHAMFQYFANWTKNFSDFGDFNWINSLRSFRSFTLIFTQHHYINHYSPWKGYQNWKWNWQIDCNLITTPWVHVNRITPDILKSPFLPWFFIFMKNHSFSFNYETMKN